MKTNIQDTKTQPSQRTGRLFFNVFLVALSVLFAIVYLREVLLLVSFVVASAVVTAIAFGLKLRPLVRRVPLTSATGQQDDYGGAVGRHRRLTLLLLLLAIMFPFLFFLSARIIEPAVWFLLLASIAAGMGVSEILFFVYRKRMVG